MAPLADVAPAFVDMAHRIAWCTVATVDTAGRPRTRVLHPIWDWDGASLVGRIATDPGSPKARHLEATPFVSLTYWTSDHDTCTADCRARWTNDPASKRACWERFATAPPPVGYDPRLIPQWTDPEVEAFGVLQLEPTTLRVMPGSLLTAGAGELLTWRTGDG